ncbi:MAG TPA: ELWxxDGT repeat protein [Thermoanaerobaculia bacterium]|nr:ELWxxDGT repeat protein [Thermoanaerobaculia bacterium]
MNRRLSRIAASFGLLCLPAVALGQTATRITEIDPRVDSASSYPRQLFPFQGKVYFAAGEPSSGRELWVTDGQGTGTRMLADLCPGECSSSPSILDATRSVLFGLSETDPYSSHQRKPLWRSDGTTGGTYLLPDSTEPVRIPTDSDEPIPALLAGGVLYFSGCAAEDGCELWRSDGTREGTRRIKDLVPGSEDSSPRQMTAAGSQVFFTTDRKLWRTDGTEEGTVLVKELAGFDTPRQLTALGGKLLFLAQAQGDELWVSDGTAAGTRPITDFAAPSPFSQTFFLEPIGGKAWLVADDLTHGAELWATDGTAAGTKQATQFGYHDPFNEGLDPGAIELLGDRLIFWASDGVSGIDLWSTSGSPESTAPVCPSCELYTDNPKLVKLGGRLLFASGDGEHGRELWRTDGTARGTTPLGDLCPGYCDGVSGPLEEEGGWVYFRGREGTNGTGEALWRSNGTPEGTRRFADVPPGGYPGVEVAILGKNVVFTARPDSSSEDLWVSDGTGEGTRRLTGFARQGGSAGIRETLVVGGRTYFTACDGERRRVWWTDGTAGGTGTAGPALDCDEDDGFPLSPLLTAGGKVFLLRSHYPGHEVWRIGADGSATQLTVEPLEILLDSVVSYKDQLFFGAEGGEIWKSDGTPQGTMRVVDLSTEIRSVAFLTPVGSELWFAADRSNSGTDGLWRTDGTQAGTHTVLDYQGFGSLNDPQITRFGSTTLFLAPIPTSSYPQLWRTDGTSLGTVLVRDFDLERRGIEAQAAEFTIFQGAVYFFANTDPSETRRALWRTDGTTAGTVILAEFRVPFSYALHHTGLTVLGSQLVFAADDGIHGTELWTSDGTAAGTRMLRDLLPGSAGSSPGHFRLAAGKLYFSATDGLHGFELWETDGTATGTRMLQDLAPEGASSNPSALNLLGNQLLFAADDGIAGQELWAFPLEGPACQPSPTVLCLNGGRFKVEVSWRDFSGNTGAGQAVALTGDTGTFWFFDPANVEVVVKVLDGLGVNGHHWVFYGALSSVEYALTVTDTRTGLARRYFNPPGLLASVGDTQGFGPLGAHNSTSIASPSPAPIVSESTASAKAAGPCVASATRLCLNNGRFAVEIAWKDFSGNTGSGKAVALSGDTGYFWFFTETNVETVVKVLDGRPVNNKFWLFYGALSNVEYTLTVTDTETGKVKAYKNPSGRFGSVGDTGAF